MAKRQLRISGDEIRSQLLDIPQLPVSVVLKNNQVFYIMISKIKTDALLAKDMRNRKMEIFFNEIGEIIIEINADQC